MTAKKILGEKYIIDGRSADTSGFTPDMSADIYYEVVRLIDGKLLFLQDHLDRLARSMAGSGIQSPDHPLIKEQLRLLLLKNNFNTGNIRICIQRKGSDKAHLLCYFVPYFYPEECMYLSGVQLLTFPHVRPNPGIKKWDDRFRVSVSQFIRDTGIYEAILLNNRKEVTEGSRSNLFFINDRNQLVSAPEQEILPGITRKYVLEICGREQIEVIHRPIPLKHLDTFRSCFISGTSPKVLPVWQLNGIGYRVDHPILKLLMEQFDLMIRQHLEDLFQ
jgi:branched-chain amino acid aminotransferase